MLILTIISKTKESNNIVFKHGYIQVTRQIVL